ncbi:uncharacterized protein [Physcomitrium patens]|uniref:Uncharacterized protein n=1 Tax=Physcomitrium patens TaxID=3218 RepID=A0A2K1ISU4_PHYPA|nr:uncharacterized protein LOC112273946 [Physcomitrium patens]PNR32346.1 hypothetical protein PHYPA_026472 [Physcomitrium patens]|eukprot:XP_024358796.1 uncharacterized protein LOC112273946 [Physcomitrella patens]
MSGIRGMGSVKWLAIIILLCFIQVSSQGAISKNTLVVESLSPFEWSSEFVNLNGGHIHGRVLLQARSNASRLLAVKGDRRDPLDSFQKYRGGYDVTNVHYWASAGFTGIYGFAIGVAWLLLGVLVTLGACCKLCCCNHARVAERRSAAYYWIPRILALLLSLFAIGVIVTMYIRNRQFHTRAFKVRDTIAGSANDAIGAVRNVTGTLSEVDTITSKYNIPGLNDGILGNTVNQLNSQANNIDRIVGDNIRNLNKIINAIQLALIVLLSVALFVVVAGLLSALLGWSTIFFLIILIGWLIAVLTWILFGVFYAANSVTSDTCQAFAEYLEAPANTTLAELLPCVDEATSARASNVVKQGVKNIVVRANGNLNGLRQAGAGVQPSVSLPALCDPIGPAPNLVYPTSCPSGTVTLAGLPEVLAPYVCNVEPVTTTCLSQRRFVTPSDDAAIRDFSAAGRSLEIIIPTITALTNCSVVYNTFDTIVTQQCPPTIESIRNLWIPLLLLSVALTLLSFDWIFANHRNKREHYASRRDPEYTNVVKP